MPVSHSHVNICILPFSMKSCFQRPALGVCNLSKWWPTSNSFISFRWLRCSKAWDYLHHMPRISVSGVFLQLATQNFSAACKDNKPGPKWPQLKTVSCRGTIPELLLAEGIGIPPASAGCQDQQTSYTEMAEHLITCLDHPNSTAERPPAIQQYPKHCKAHHKWENENDAQDQHQ